MRFNNMIRFALLLSWFFTCFGVQVSGQCQDDKDIFMKQGFRLHGHVLEAFWAQTVALCRIKCYLEKRCSTYNYESATQRCELNKAVISSQWKDLRRNQGFVYVDMKKTTTTPVDQVLCKQSVAVGIQNNSIISKYYFTIDKDSYYGDQARLNGPGGWYSNNRNKYHWLKINLGKIAMITRIATQGHHKYHQWVTSYSLATSTNGSTPYTSYNNGQVFPANKDANTIVYNDLKPAIKARYVKVYPKTWRKAVGLRMEIYECKEYEETCSHALGMQSQLIKDKQVTASSYYTAAVTFEPSKSRLNHSKAWVSQYNENQWLQIDLLSIKKITGIATQGHSSWVNHWVREFLVQYLNSSSGLFIDYLNGSKTFMGNKDHNSIVYNAIDPPIVASVVRIKPSLWNEKGRVAMRVELYGCSENSSNSVPCTEPLGMQSGLINDSQITASSYYNRHYKRGPWQARLDYERGWIAKHPAVPNTWLQIVFDKVMKIAGISTQGNKNWNAWVKRYTVQYSNSTMNVTDFKEGNATKIFEGNSENKNIVYNAISPPIIANVVRIVPTKWKWKWITMKIELYGCH